MYEKRFGLARRPFPATPDSSLYYPACQHEAALAQVQRALVDNESLAVLTGPAGTGKTLVGLTLSERLQAETAFLTNSHFPDRVALLQSLLFEFSQPYESGSEQVLRLRLTDHLLKNCREKKRTIVLVDEAQNLSLDLLEEIRLLGNLEAGMGKAFQALLIAQPSFLDLLRRPELESLRQRLAVRAQLAPLGVEESLDYLLHHLRLAGGEPEKIFDEAGIEVLARGTCGIPRLLNQAGHQALLLADAADLPIVDAEAALEALALLGLEAEEPADNPGMEALAEPPGLTVRLAEETRQIA